MTRIQRLPDDLVDKIAAGEVVERPASVVKELVENALDAGAERVIVEIEAGGKSLVRVRDDGWGMGREDTALAIERHATSKLKTVQDLHSIATHGFRGEALPSIASVSHLVLRTRLEHDAAGTEVEVRHGRLVHVRDAGHPRGTTVEVRDLFGAVPARRKFLRADATEAAHVSEAVTLLALARPATAFSLTSNGRAVVEAPPVEGLGARVYQLFGGRFLDDLVSVEGGTDWVHVFGLVSRPDRPGPSRPSVRLYVNGRPVRDRALSKALAEAYRGAGSADRRFEAILFLEAPLHLVDVNVHPAKTEVRFADARTPFSGVERAVREALSAGARREAPRVDTWRVEEAVEGYMLSSSPGHRKPEAGVGAAPAPSGEGLDSQAAPDSRAPDSSALELQESWLPTAPPTVLGQHRNTYIVATDGEDLLLLDQHTAHERIRFERLMGELGRHAVASQRLLAPLVVDLSAELSAVLGAERDSLFALGFDVEPFGRGSVSLAAVPAGLGARDSGIVLTDLLRDLLERETAEWAVSGSRERVAATLACHSSARAGEPLSGELMAAIVCDLGRTAHPTLCPHGRPTILRIPRGDVSRWFGRAGWRRR